MISKVFVKGGGHPCRAAVQKIIAKAKDPAWYPGKPARSSDGDKGGRPPVYSDHQKAEVARVAMEMKRKLKAPTPRRVRARLPQLSRNPDTGKPMSKQTVHRIYKLQCYDEDEDDPWQFLDSIKQDVLPSTTKPLRVKACKQILADTTPRSWYGQVAIDPCYSLLPKTEDRSEEQLIKAMGSKKWRSKGSRVQANFRAPATVGTQGTGNNYHTNRVDWTPVFARGKILIYVLDKDAAAARGDLPEKLTDSKNLAKFVKNVLPGLLEKMKRRHGWSDIPRTIIHDKASYFIPPMINRLQSDFAEALRKGGFRSWVGTEADSAQWLVRKFGDVYPHETAISHIRRLLDNDFCHPKLHESPAHFRQRMQKVEDYMNSNAFAGEGGDGLLGLTKSLRDRCEDVIKRGGERLPK